MSYESDLQPAFLSVLNDSDMLSVEAWGHADHETVSQTGLIGEASQQPGADGLDLFQMFHPAPKVGVLPERASSIVIPPFRDVDDESTDACVSPEPVDLPPSRPKNDQHAQHRARLKRPYTSTETTEDRESTLAIRAAPATRATPATAVTRKKQKTSGLSIQSKAYIRLACNDPKLVLPNTLGGLGQSRDIEFCAFNANGQKLSDDSRTRVTFHYLDSNAEMKSYATNSRLSITISTGSRIFESASRCKLRSIAIELRGKRDNTVATVRMTRGPRDEKINAFCLAFCWRSCAAVLAQRFATPRKPLNKKLQLRTKARQQRAYSLDVTCARGVVVRLFSDGLPLRLFANERTGYVLNDHSNTLCAHSSMQRLRMPVGSMRSLKPSIQATPTTFTL